MREKRRKGTLYGKYFSTVEYEVNNAAEGLSRARSRKKRVYSLFAPRRTDNIRAAKRSFMQRVHEGIAVYGKPLFCTFTFAERVADVRVSDKRFKAFTVRLRSVFSDAKWIAVREFQDKRGRGAVHYHALVWGLPDTLGDDVRNGVAVVAGSERKSRVIAGLWGYGFVDIRKTDGGSRLVSYIGKYMAKSGGDVRLAHHRLWLQSRGFVKPWVFYDQQLDTILASSKMKVLFVKDVQSSWLHNLKYSLYEREI